jgi:hypothetical protein
VHGPFAAAVRLERVRTMNARQIVVRTFLMNRIAVTITAYDTGVTQRGAPLAMKLQVEGELPPFAAATAWLNSPAQSAIELRGKVVLVEFWACHQGAGS